MKEQQKNRYKNIRITDDMGPLEKYEYLQWVEKLTKGSFSDKVESFVLLTDDLRIWRAYEKLSKKSQTTKPVSW